MVDQLYWSSSSNAIFLSLDGLSGPQAKAALAGLTLNVVDAQGNAFAVSDAQTFLDLIYWPFEPYWDWTDGQKVLVSLTLDGIQQAPPQLTGFRAVPQDGAVWLTWDEVMENIEVPDGKHQVRYRARGSSSWGEWTPWRDTVGQIQATVSGLTNDTRYQFEGRLVNAGGPGPASARVEAKALATSAAPTGLTANSADAAVILHWNYADNDSITGYQYRYQVKDGGLWSNWTAVPVPPAAPDHSPLHASDLTQVTVSPLSNGLEWEFQVRARNANGWGKPSAAASATPEALAAAPEAQSVSHDWAHIPEDADGNPLVKPGESFRLLFVTSFGTAASSTRINDYNRFVQDRVAKTPSQLKSFKDQFRAVISTAAVSARENIGADLEGNDVPVYWVSGGLVVGGNLFDDDWSKAPPRDEGGGLSSATQVWTGSLRDGKTWSVPADNPWWRFYAGAAHVETGNPARAGDQIMHRETIANPPANTTELPLYGISPVITVQEPPSQ